jgi:hypothetical protein
MPDNPMRQRNVITWRRVVGISHGLTGAMTTHTNPIQLLVRELDIVSRTSGNRRVLLRIDAAGLDLLGCTTASELARTITWDPRMEESPHHHLDALMPLSGGDHQIALIVMVALRRPLRDIWFSIVRAAQDSDVGAEMFAVLWSQFARVDESGDIDEILETVLLETRRKVRRDTRECATYESIEGLDFIDGESNPYDITDNLLGHLGAQGIVSREDADVIRATRIDGVPFRDFVRTRNLVHSTTWKRRQRAEEIIAGHLSRNPGLV